MESMRNPFEDIANDVLSSEKSISEKISAIEAVKSVDSLTLETYISFVRELIRKLSEKCKSDSEECKVFESFLVAISDVAISSHMAPRIVIEEIISILNNVDMDSINKEFISAILSSLTKLARVRPESIFVLKETIERILRKFVSLDIYSKVFDVLEVASWSLPPVFSEFKKILRNLPETEFKSELTSRYYKFVARVGKRNYYIIKSEVMKVLEELYSRIDYNKLILLSSITLPNEDISMAREIFDILETKLEGIEDPRVKKAAISTLANISKNIDFVELQNRFIDLITEVIISEMVKEIKKATLEAISIVHWNPRVNLGNLVDAISDVVLNTAEEDEIRFASVESLFKISFLPQAPKREIIGILIQVLDSPGSSDLKAETIDALVTLARWTRDELDNIIRSLLSIASRLDEEDFVRIRALDSLTDLIKQNPEKITNFVDEIVEIWNISTEWGIKDSVAKLVGEALLRVDRNIRELLDILIRGLEDTYIYRMAIEYLLRISFLHPEYLVGEVDKILRAYDTIRSVELELVEEGTDVLGGDYFYLVETSKRYLARLIAQLGVASDEAFEITVDTLLKQFSEEKNEIVEREIAYNLAKLYEKNSEKFRNMLTKHLLEEKKLKLLNKFGVYP